MSEPTHERKGADLKNRGFLNSEDTVIISSISIILVVILPYPKPSSRGSIAPFAERRLHRLATGRPGSPRNQLRACRVLLFCAAGVAHSMITSCRVTRARGCGAAVAVSRRTPLRSMLLVTDGSVSGASMGHDASARKNKSAVKTGRPRWGWTTNGHARTHRGNTHGQRKATQTTTTKKNRGYFRCVTEVPRGVIKGFEQIAYSNFKKAI